MEKSKDFFKAFKNLNKNVHKQKISKTLFLNPNNNYFKLVNDVTCVFPNAIYSGNIPRQLFLFTFIILYFFNVFSED